MRQESWVDFGNDLLLLTSKVFPSLQDEVREELALSKYLDQLEDLQISFGVKQRHPKTIQEAKSNTIKLKSYLVESASRKLMQVMWKNPQEQADIAVIQSTERGLMDMMQRLVKRVEVTSQKSRLQPSNQPLRRNQANEWTQ